MSIKVLLVDDQGMVRAGIHMILEVEKDIHVVGEAEDGAKAIMLVHKLKPVVVLMDIQMPLMNGLDATRQIIQTPGNTSRVLILTTFDRDDYVFEAIEADLARERKPPPAPRRRACARGAFAAVRGAEERGT